jgi:hypothetical protein
MIEKASPSSRLNVSHRMPNGYEFVFESQSRQAGYGDRTDMVLAQVITMNRDRIGVKQGQVTSAVMDGK